MSAGERSNDATRLFLSYSRRDRDFVERLASALRDRGYLADFDLTPEAGPGMDVGISAEDEWWPRLQEMITAADVVLFVLTPNSIASRVCDEEVAFSRASGKRVIALLHKAIDFSLAPPRIAALNVKLDFAREALFEHTLELLVRAIEQDVTWLRGISRLAVLARRWEASGRPPDQLLRGTDLFSADELVARRPSSAPELSELLLSYLAEGRKQEFERRALSQAERARYLELIRIMRPFLEEELLIRQLLPVPAHSGVADEMQLEKDLVRSLLHLDGRWHPEPGQYVQSTGARDGYAEIFRFPCCDRVAKDFLSTGEGDPPSQFRPDGCQDVPNAMRHEYKERSNRFQPQLVVRYRALASGTH